MEPGEMGPATPPLVAAALALARRMGFPHSCSPETGRLLRVLAAQARQGTVAEIGTGCGVGAAWIASGLPPGGQLVTVESDGGRARACQALFAPLPSVRVLHGDWHAILAEAPFALLFADGDKAKEREPRRLLEALAPGGLLVIDDLTPLDRWPPAWRGRPDPVRDFWLTCPELSATEVRVRPDEAVILAVRRG